MRRFWTMSLVALMLFAWIPPAGAVLPPAGGSGYGVVVDPASRPIPGAEVEVYRLDGGLADVLISGRDGSFCWGGGLVPGGTEGRTLWRLRVWADGYQTVETGWIDPALQPYQRLQLDPLLGEMQVTLRNGDGEPLSGSALLIASDGRLVAERPVREGVLRFAGLMTGEYRLLITSTGHLPVTTDVTVAPGRAATALITLAESGLSLSGLVDDAITGLPLPGATVELLAGNHTLAASGETDEAGWFRLYLPQGDTRAYRLRVTAPGYRAAETDLVELTHGQAVELSGNEAVLMQPLTGTLAGNLFSDYGGALGSLPVILQAKGYGEIAEAKTDKQGEFRFDAVTVGPETEYRLSSGHPDHAFSTPWLKLRAGSLTQVMVQAETAMTYTVGLGKVAGIVATPSGAPVSGARVELLRSAGWTKSAETAEDGSFLISNVPANWLGGWATEPYLVRISKDGFIPTREFLLDGGAATELTVAPGRRNNIRATLTPAVAMLRGRVTGPKGHPVAGAEVTLSADGEKEEWTATTDALGWYRLPQVAIRPALDYFLRVRADGYLTATGVVVTEAVMGLGVTGTATEALTGQGSLPALRLTPELASLTGQVLSPGGEPLAGARMRLRSETGSTVSETVTDATGFYRLEAALSGSDPVTLIAELDGWTTTAAVITQPPVRGASLMQDLVIFPTASGLGGRVLDERSQPMAGVRVELLQEGRGVIGMVTTDREGRYRFSGLTPDGSGWYGLRVRTGAGRFAGSLTHGTAVAPLIRLLPGEEKVIDLLVRRLEK